MELDLRECARYAGITGPAPEALQRELEAAAEQVKRTAAPRYTYRFFDLERRDGGVALSQAGLRLTGRSAQTMLAGCRGAVLLCCTLGAGFDAMLRREQRRDMSRAVLLDGCGSAWVEAGCDAAEQELRRRVPGAFLTDRFSPGYGDFPLAAQKELCAVLDAFRRLGVSVSDSFLLNPVKSVTAVIGVADSPQPARIRGCAFCAMRETCAMRKGGNRCVS